MNRIKILYVEDNKGDIMLFEDAMEESGLNYVLDTAPNGDQAYKLLTKAKGYEDKQTPDLIILDINMPVMNGFELLDIIKADDKLKHLPVIMFTTSSAKNDILIAYRKYANSFLIKPADSNEYSYLINGIKEYWFKLAVLPTR